MDSSVVEQIEHIEQTEPTNSIKVKDHFTGKVAKVSLAGALIDIGAAQPAVMHISQLPLAENGEPVKRVEDLLQIGQDVDVWVRRVKDDHLELTMIKPLDLEWREIKKGMTVNGKVVRLEKFGAFIEIGAERPGLVHISEMAHGYVRTPGDVLKEGDEVEAQVLDVNRRKRQIKLSLKALQPEPNLEEMVAQPNPTKTKPARGGRKGDRRGYEGESANVAQPEKPAEPDPTAMELAIRAAMEKSKDTIRPADERGKKKGKGKSNEQEDILTRTLESKASGR
jgi:small subunit ribosomal protein S1